MVHTTAFLVFINMCLRKQLFCSCGKAQIPHSPFWQESVNLREVNAKQTYRKVCAGNDCKC